MDNYPNHPAMQDYRRRAYLMAYRAAQRSVSDDSAPAYSRWSRRHRNTPVAWCESNRLWLALVVSAVYIFERAHRSR